MNGQPAIAVVVPTFNRLPALKLCLQHLERQTFTGFEVVVVDDGSTDGTSAALLEIQHRSPLRMRVLHQENAGPARARNLALAHVAAPLCLLIGDDILASPTLVQAHLDFHHAHPERTAAALGRTQWDSTHQRVTPFMQWYEKIQFDYARLAAGLTPTWLHFYTSNVSLKTSLLQANPFDERFTAAAWEDAELGYRLSLQGELRLTYLPDAIATHLHPTTLAQAIRRMRTVGRAERRFHELWPAARDPAAPDRKARIASLLGSHRSLLFLLTAAARLVPDRLRPGKLDALLLRAHHQFGYREAALPDL